MANHGYINRSGKGVSFRQIARGLRECYGLTWFFSWFLSLGCAFLIRRWGPISLADVAVHGRVEHDASLAHADTVPGEVHAPLPVNKPRYEEAMKWMCEGGGEVIDAHDVVRARVNREKYCPPLDAVHAEIARGEMAIALRMFNHPSANPFNDKEGIPVEWLKEFLAEERLPMGGTWRPDHKVGMLSVVSQAREMKNIMDKTRKDEGDKAAAGSLWREDIQITVKPTNGDAGEHARHESTSSMASTSSTVFSADDSPAASTIHHSRNWSVLTRVDETAQEPGKK